MQFVCLTKSFKTWSPKGKIMKGALGNKKCGNCWCNPVVWWKTWFSITPSMISLCLPSSSGRELTTPWGQAGQIPHLCSRLLVLSLSTLHTLSSFGDAQFSSHLCCQWLSAWGNLVTGFDSQNRHLYEDRIRPCWAWERLLKFTNIQFSSPPWPHE